MPHPIFRPFFSMPRFCARREVTAFSLSVTCMNEGKEKLERNGRVTKRSLGKLIINSICSNAVHHDIQT